MTVAETRPAGPAGPMFYTVLVAMSAVGPLALNIFMPSMPGLQDFFGVPYGMVQLTLTLYLVGMAVSQLIYGPLSDRFGRRPVVLAGLVLFVVASLVAAVAPTIHVLIAARLAQAVGGAAGIVLARAIVRDLFDRDKSASVIGYITMAFVLAPMLAPSLGGSLDGLAGWRSSFWLLAGFGAAVLVAAWLALPETNTRRDTSTAVALPLSFGRLLRIARFRGYTLTLALASSVFFAFLAGAPYVMVVLLKRTPLEYGVWFVIISFGYMAGNFLTGRYSQLFGIDRMVSFGNLLTLAGGFLALMAAVFGILSPATVFLPMMVAAFGNGLTLPNGTAGAISVDPALVGAAAGLSGFIQMGCGAAASQIVGSLQGDWPLAVFWFMAGASVLAALSHALNRS